MRGCVTLGRWGDLAAGFLQVPNQRRDWGLWIKHWVRNRLTQLPNFLLLQTLHDLGQITSLLCATLSAGERGWEGESDLTLVPSSSESCLPCVSSAAELRAKVPAPDRWVQILTLPRNGAPAGADGAFCPGAPEIPPSLRPAPGAGSERAEPCRVSLIHSHIPAAHPHRAGCRSPMFCWNSITPLRPGVASGSFCITMAELSSRPKIQSGPQTPKY